MVEKEQPVEAFSQEEQAWIQAQRQREADRQKRKARRGGGDDDDGNVNINSLMDIMVIMLVFLLKSYGDEPIRATADDLKVPTSTSQVPPEDTMTVLISRKRITVESGSYREEVVAATGGEVDSHQMGGESNLTIEPLLSELGDLIEAARRRAEEDDEEYEPEITIIADQTVRHRLIVEVLHTATEAELQNFRFAIIRSASESVGGVDG